MKPQPSQAFTIPIGDSSLRIPAGALVPDSTFWNAAIEADRLAREGYGEISRREVERLQAFFASFPGEPKAPSGHRLTDRSDACDALLTWYVVRSATRQEKRAEHGLVEAGFAVYVPRMARTRRIGRRKERVEQPLFSGYMFVGLMDGQSLYGVHAVCGVHKVVTFSADRNPRPISFAPIVSILGQEQRGEFDNSIRHAPDPAPGSSVDIIGGQFQGFPAQFVKRRADERIELLFQMFGRWSPLTLKADEVRGLGDNEEAQAHV